MKCSFTLASVALACACSSSSGGDEVTHDAGRKVDASHSDGGNKKKDAGEADAGEGAIDANLPDVNPCQPDVSAEKVFPANSGATWSALYADFFGPKGQASCGGGGTEGGDCHGSVTQHGYMASNFLCPLEGDASAECWKGMTSKGDGGANLVDVQFDAGLGGLLCQNYCVGIMPLNCTYYFSPDDMSRIHAWVKAGGKDD